MRTIYLHAGQHKTGTTQIQLALGRFHNRDVLNENNFEYPLLSKHSDHQYLHTYIIENQSGERSDSEAQVMTIQLLDYIGKSNKNIIISAEGLQEAPPKVVRELLSNHNVVVILYIREQADYLFSAYQHEVKSGFEPRSFDEWFYAHGNDIGAYYLNTWITTWEDAFGAENVIVRRYGKKYLVNDDVVADFLTVVGLPHLVSRLVEKRRSNIKIDIACHTAMRIINSFGFTQKYILNGTYNALETLSSISCAPSLGCDVFLVNEIRRRSIWENSILARRRFGGDPLFVFNSIQSEVGYSIVEVTVAFLRICVLSFWRSPKVVFRIFYRFLLRVFSFRYFYFFRKSAKYSTETKYKIRERVLDQIKIEEQRNVAVIQDRDKYIAHLENQFHAERSEQERLIEIIKDRDKYILHLKNELHVE